MRGWSGVLADLIDVRAVYVISAALLLTGAAVGFTTKLEAPARTTGR